MDIRPKPAPIPSENLPAHFLSNGIAFTAIEPLRLNFGHGNDQYRLYPYPGPADDETMGVFVEWHTGDFFAVDSGPHFAIGMRGPVREDPHRGRGLAIGILASHMDNPGNPDQPIPLFKGCPGPPGGPAFFIEDFSRNDGTAPITAWQLSMGQELALLQGNQSYRIDVHVSSDRVWAGVWMIMKSQTGNAANKRTYKFLGSTTSPEDSLESGENITTLCQQTQLDRGRGNAFIGTAFADPETNSWVDNIYIAHWKGSFPES